MILAKVSSEAIWETKLLLPLGASLKRVTLVWSAFRFLVGVLKSSTWQLVSKDQTLNWSTIRSSKLQLAPTHHPYRALRMKLQLTWSGFDLKTLTSFWVETKMVNSRCFLYWELSWFFGRSIRPLTSWKVDKCCTNQLNNKNVTKLFSEWKKNNRGRMIFGPV